MVIFWRFDTDTSKPSARVASYSWIVASLMLCGIVAPSLTCGSFATAPLIV
ncbi:hypothetical protein M6B38_290830 [Iris pallida]|uniref:Uncharacterized protein n=1 Tax=Iris pallida TaxID=29817 RepID=A0AAX6E1W7_IRIPA|nr:hypothetical protein M6B38_223110 [Iris pallida]KAJ6797959.1 hypothetical protein M6B38_215520 [Iris pallida]KAJ6844884.1 hypothetical protein M6B38_290830 [Iris pallida]